MRVGGGGEDEIDRRITCEFRTIFHDHKFQLNFALCVNYRTFPEECMLVFLYMLAVKIKFINYLNQ